MTNPSRRQFLGASAATATLATLSPWTSPWTTPMAHGFTSPNEQPGIGYVGTGIRFHSALGPQGTEFGVCLGLADVDYIQLGRALQRIRDRHRGMNKSLAIATHMDYRHLLDNPAIDILYIGTPDHWHTKPLIEAMKAGKDVYCEKPLTLTIREGEQIEQVMKETGRIVQVGTQQRTEFGRRFMKAIAIARSGRIGKIKKVTVCVGGSRTCDPLPVVPPPKHLNWLEWQGQCQPVDYRSANEIVDTSGWGAGHPFSRTHRYYRWFYEYSGGKLTDWGAHHVDIAMLALDKLGDDVGAILIEPLHVTHPVNFNEKGMPLAEDRFNCATEFNVRCTFADGIEMYIRHSAQEDLGFENGILFEGEKGRFLVNRGKLVGKPVEELEENPLPDDALESVYGRALPVSHMSNFIESVNSRIQPISDVVTHNRMLNVCHAVNISMRLNQTLTYETGTRRFTDNPVANGLVEREQRAGYEIVV